MSCPFLSVPVCASCDACPVCRQAKLPEYRGGAHAGAPGRPTGPREQRLWVPGRTADSDLMMFVRAARSMAEFAGICDGSSTNTEFRKPAERDDTTQNALDVVSADDAPHQVQIKLRVCNAI